MGNCPYCRSVTLPGDTICYTCGRVLANIKSKEFAAEQQFNQGSIETTYRKTRKPSKSGVVETHTGRRRNILKRRKNKFRSVVMLGLVAFIMLSPQAREIVFDKWAGVNEYIQLAVAPYHLYPVEATYTVGKTIDVVNNGNTGYLKENLAIPRDVSTLNGQQNMFEYTNGDPAVAAQTIQKINSIALIVNEISYAIPLLGEPARDPNDKLTTSDGHEIWWPGVGIGDDMCSVDICVKIRLNLDPGEQASFTFAVTLTSTSYSWWSSSRVDSRIDGISNGISVDRSGSFSDIIDRGDGTKAAQFTTASWYNKGRLDYAINAQDAVVVSTAETISASLPEGRSTNAYAFARAAFDYLHLNVLYDKNAPVVARSGPACLSAGVGDCDEQTNAFFSLLRTKMIPGWYVFGALTDSTFTYWEAHAWGYILLPMDDEWCEARNIVINDCYVEGSVDVVNNKWLLHTPTAYIDWIESADASGNLINNYYKPGVYSNNIDRQRSFSTMDTPDTSGGTYQIKKLPENLR